jgi:hypothetical protein
LVVGSSPTGSTKPVSKKLNHINNWRKEKYPSPAEGIGLENRQAVKGAGVRIPLSPPLLNIAG